MRLRREQADPSRDALDVPVDRHQRHPEREQQHDRGGLHADALDRGEPGARLERGHLAEELERVVAAGLADGAQGGLDALRLLVRQATRPDDLDELVEYGAASTIDQSGVTPSGSPTPPQPGPGT